MLVNFLPTLMGNNALSSLLKYLDKNTKIDRNTFMMYARRHAPFI